MKLEILPVLGIGDVVEGDDLAALIGRAAPWLRDGDVLVVTSKIVSKAEGRLVDVPVEEPERTAAREEILAAETARTVARRGPTRIVQTHHGFVMASAGIDASNVDQSRLVLLPKDPDASARSLRAALRERHGADVAVIISDTMGRPWRNGLTDVALGAAGIGAIRDHRGEIDPYGNELSVTQMAVIDELAGAGELVKGKCDQVPVAVVRGYLAAPADPEDGAGAAALVRDAAQDLFSLGTAEARALGLREAATLPDRTQRGGPATGFDGPAEAGPATAESLTGPPTHTGAAAHAGTGPAAAAAVRQPDPAAAIRAIALVSGAVTAGTRLTLADPATVAELAVALPDWPAASGGAVVAHRAGGADPAGLIRFGADLHRLRAALAAEGIETTLLIPPAGGKVDAVLAL